MQEHRWHIYNCMVLVTQLVAAPSGPIIRIFGASMYACMGAHTALPGGPGLHNPIKQMIEHGGGERARMWWLLHHVPPCAVQA